MVFRWARCALGLAACVLIASTASGQEPERRAAGGHRRGILGPNQPNPFSDGTTIAFTVGDGACANATQPHLVTLRIYNVLSQIVAVATLVDSANAAQSAGGGSPSQHGLSSHALPCGSYAARWEGKHQDGRDAAPGVYMYQLVIDGHPAGMRKMILKR
jgi:hypothetical protein